MLFIYIKTLKEILKYSQKMTQTCAHFKVKINVRKIHIKLNGEMSVIKSVDIFYKNKKYVHFKNN